MLAILQFVLFYGILISILVTALAILNAIKFGFTEVIKGLQAISDRLDNPR